MSRNKRYGKEKKTNNKGGKGYNSQSDKHSTPDTGRGAFGSKENSPKSNDIQWWNQSEIFADATRLPFNRITNAVYDMASIFDGTGFALDAFGDYTALGDVMQIKFIPHIGYSASVNSPVNRAFTSVYAGIYSKTTGAMQFTQASLSILTLGMDSIVTNIGMVKRALAASHVWVDNDMGYPQVILKACGFDPETIIGKQDEIRQRLNNCIRNLNAMRSVQLFSTTPRHYQLATNIYLDEARLGAQSYVFTPAGYYTFVEAGDDPDFESEGLTYHDFATDDVFEILDIIDDQLSRVRHSSAFALVSGSVQRAYPDADLLLVAPVDGTEIINPIFDRNMLWQINNLNYAPKLYAPSLSIYEDIAMDYIVARPVAQIDISTAPSKDSMCLKHVDFLNSYDGDTSSEFVMESTRLKNMMEVEDDTVYVTNFGTELITETNIFIPWGAPGKEQFAIGSTGNQSQRIVVTNANNDALIYLVSSSHFRNAPLLYLSRDGMGTISLPCGEMNVWTTIDFKALDGLNEAALLSAYNPDKYVVKL